MNMDPEHLRVVYQKLKEDAENGGYHLNPDEQWTLNLVQGLLTNEARYGYWACPCRLASGNKEEDLDIICPCDYRDPDLHDYGACYCALYVSDEVVKGERELAPVSERRPAERPKRAKETSSSGITLWRCRVCGYLCAREHPPGVCPICKAKSDRFEPFVLPVGAIPANVSASGPLQRS